ncbi:Y-family DNA polymerase [Rubeoparvulum massiliense]|uniref:Y-family DNA polymerase n=1 Tax=Rubeoparvulum massiliense TaxID=1631346 RepID=UPI000AFD5B25|nr:DNA polymerase IV [Rubeoparvulum massiliense]
MVLLVDMNSFFASVHQSEDPSLRGKPVIIAGDPKLRKGIVIAASYEAKAKGIYTTMRYHEALERCPDGIFIRPNHPLYRKYSQTIMRFLAKVAPCEVASIDEAYLDVSEIVERGVRPLEIARYIQNKLERELSIPCSIGAGPNKIIAKMCADVKKPRGYVEMGVRQFQSYFWPQAVSKLHGCGQRTSEKLNQRGIITIGQLAQLEIETLRNWYGKQGEYLYWAARGMTQSPVDPMRRKGSKSMGISRTFPHDVDDEERIAGIIHQYSLQMSQQLKRKKVVAKTISIDVKISYEKGRTRSCTLEEATRDPKTIEETAIALYQTHFKYQPLRLLGIRVSNLESDESILPYPVQLSFQFTEGGSMILPPDFSDK